MSVPTSPYLTNRCRKNERKRIEWVLRNMLLVQMRLLSLYQRTTFRWVTWSVFSEKKSWDSLAARCVPVSFHVVCSLQKMNEGGNHIQCTVLNFSWSVVYQFHI